MASIIPSESWNLRRNQAHTRSSGTTVEKKYLRVSTSRWNSTMTNHSMSQMPPRLE